MGQNSKGEKQRLLVPDRFLCSGNPFDDYEVIGGDALRSNDPVLAHIRAAAIAGHMDIDADFMAKLPNLEIIAKRGVGYDNVDVAAATRAGVIVTNTPDVLTDEVADLTLGLLIATVRRIPQADRYVRDGKWPAAGFPLSSSLRGRKVGIAGLGRIGAAIARRVQAMDLEVGYYGRRQQPDVAWPYFDRVVDLARASDVLIVMVPGGPDTHNLINGEVLKALGPDGVLINVARGSVVDEAALIEALRTGTIAAAGLDVFVDEPAVPRALIELENTVLLPHVGSGTTTTREAMGDLVFTNLQSWFAGKGAVTPVN
ncbi:MAG: 2-hydroxyacid dehydrogenase [Rhodospirillales bacterium]|nr:2-hydroxyacid dehydrogenase [Rhodospirillales bacterium]